MQINISNLSEGVYSYDLVEKATNLGFDDQFDEIVAAHVTLEKSINQLLLTVKASVKGVFVCDRCADEFDENVETSFTTVYSWENDDVTEDDDDFHVLSHDQNIIDVSDSVRDYLLLAVPAKHLCGKRTCEIPKQSVVEKETVDPRWEKLKELIKPDRN
ncbi:MAG: DUF177 domain-containing protein [Bacteroidota bacterium]|nr:DUF177 domain-containing protein [Bacteroidota bacterium]